MSADGAFIVLDCLTCAVYCIGFLLLAQARGVNVKERFCNVDVARFLGCNKGFGSSAEQISTNSGCFQFYLWVCVQLS